MSAKPYIGITGLTEPGHLDQLRGFLRNSPLPAGRQLMVGALASAKSLRGEQPRPEWQGRYSAPEDLATIIGLRLGETELFKVIHYNSKESRLDRQLIELTNYAPSLDAVQLNIRWPDPMEILEFRVQFRNLWLRECRVVLQVGSEAMGEPNELQDRLAPYSGLLDYVLLDASRGLGRPLNVNRIRRCLDSVPWEYMQLLPVVAGGLSAETVDQLAPLLREWPDLSWDAEGRLRTDGQLDLAKCSDYLAASGGLLDRVIV